MKTWFPNMTAKKLYSNWPIKRISEQEQQSCFHLTRYQHQYNSTTFTLRVIVRLLFILIQVLDHALSGQEGKENCNKFVEILGNFFLGLSCLYSYRLGLRTLFPLFLRTPSKVKRKDTSPDEHEEHVTAVSFFLNIPLGICMWKLDLILFI